MQQHYPSLVVLAESWVGCEKTDAIISDLGFDSWHLLEPNGFVGGVLLMWKSHILDFHVIGEGAQGVYGGIFQESHLIIVLSFLNFKMTPLSKAKNLFGLSLSGSLTRG